MNTRVKGTCLLMMHSRPWGVRALAGSARAVLNYCAPSILIPEKNLSPHPSLPASLPLTFILSQANNIPMETLSLLAATPFFSFHAGRPSNFIPRQHVSVIAFDVPTMSNLSPSLPIEEHFPPAGTKNASLFCFESYPPIIFDSQGCKCLRQIG